LLEPGQNAGGGPGLRAAGRRRKEQTGTKGGENEL